MRGYGTGDLIATEWGRGQAFEVEERPHEKRRGRFKNGNPPGDFTKAPRCRTKTRRGSECQCSAMINGRCRLVLGKEGSSEVIRTRNGIRYEQNVRAELRPAISG
jgi:hypothetical protein